MTAEVPADISVIIPAHNEARFIGVMLEALIASELDGVSAELVVVPNGCSDATADIARGYAAQAEAAGWTLKVVESVEGGKPLALNLGESVASGKVLVYVDADVIVSPGLVAALAKALDSERPLYGSGRPVVKRSPSAATRAYARIWKRLPMLKATAPGFGVYAMNRAGRARWGDWPAMRGDDAYARLVFAPAERIEVPHSYEWPLTDGFWPLVLVRRRQDDAAREIAGAFPELTRNHEVVNPGLGGALWLLATDPPGMLVYSAVKILGRMGTDKGGWVRTR